MTKTSTWPTSGLVIPTVRPLALPTDFEEWRSAVSRRSALPIIGVAGSRGKTSTIRYLSAMYRSAGLRVATWTNQGVEINGAAQLGELSAWREVITGLLQGEIDVAVQELHWETIHAVGLPEGSYPVLSAVSICRNSDAGLALPDSQLALHAYDILRAALESDGVMVLNSDEYALALNEVASGYATIGVGMQRESPMLVKHLEGGGVGLWLYRGNLIVERDGVTTKIPGSSAGRFYDRRSDPAMKTTNGSRSWSANPYDDQNVMQASAIALATGIGPSQISAALTTYRMSSSTPTGDFARFLLDRGQVILDRPAPSWFLRPILRALHVQKPGRLITVVGSLDGIPKADLPEVGRLLARVADVLVVPRHQSDACGEQLQDLKTGIVSAGMPPPIIHTRNEAHAIRRAIARLHENDVVLVLTHDHEPIRSAIAAGSEPAIQPATKAGA